MRVYTKKEAVLQSFPYMYLGVLDGHDDAGGQHELLPGLADVEDVDAILRFVSRPDTVTTISTKTRG